MPSSGPGQAFDERLKGPRSHGKVHTMKPADVGFPWISASGCRPQSVVDLSAEFPFVDVGFAKKFLFKISAMSPERGHFLGGGGWGE